MISSASIVAMPESSASPRYGSHRLSDGNCGSKILAVVKDRLHVAQGLDLYPHQCVCHGEEERGFREPDLGVLSL